MNLCVSNEYMFRMSPEVGNISPLLNIWLKKKEKKDAYKEKFIFQLAQRHSPRAVWIFSGLVSSLACV